MMTLKVLGSIGSVGLMVGVVAGSGCWRHADSHCGNLDGPQTCEERGVGQYCNVCVAANDGCTDQEPAEGCQFVEGLGVGGVSGDVGDTASGGITMGGATTSDATVGGITSLEGGIDAEGTTFEAGDEADATTGTSCAGQCGGNTPICDEESDTCVACQEHAECGEAACNFFTGGCLSARIVHVGPEQSYSGLKEAVASFTMDTALEGTIIVHDNGSPYQDTVVVGGERTIAFLAFGEEPPIWDSEDGRTPLRVDGATATGLLDGIVLTGGTGHAPGLRVTDGGRAWVDRAWMIENAGGGVLVEKDAEAVLRNCFVDGPLEGFNALEIDGGRATVLYSTLAVGVWNSAALSCTNPAAVVVRNSIIVAHGDPTDIDPLFSGNAVDVGCSGATVDITYTAAESSVPGTGNREVGQMPASNTAVWFVDYVNEDFHLQNDGLEVFANVAQWRAGDPRTDIDGDPRPVVDGTPDHAGADRP